MNSAFRFSLSCVTSAFGLLWGAILYWTLLQTFSIYAQLQIYLLNFTLSILIAIFSCQIPTTYAMFYKKVSCVLIQYGQLYVPYGMMHRAPVFCKIAPRPQPRPQGLLAFQYGGGSGEDPGTERPKTVADWRHSYMSSDWFTSSKSKDGGSLWVLPATQTFLFLGLCDVKAEQFFCLTI